MLIHRIWSHVLKKSVMENFILCAIVKHKKRVKLLSILHSAPLGVDAQRCSVKKLLLKISQNSQENTFTTVCFLIKCRHMRPNKKRLWSRCFPVSFVKFLRTPFLIEHLWWLLLHPEITSLSLAHKKYSRDAT